MLKIDGLDLESIRKKYTGFFSRLSSKNCLSKITKMVLFLFQVHCDVEFLRYFVFKHFSSSFCFSSFLFPLNLNASIFVSGRKFVFLSIKNNQYRRRQADKEAVIKQNILPGKAKKVTSIFFSYLGKQNNLNFE